MRLDVTGNLYLCLGQENQVPLGDMLRAGASDKQLTQAMDWTTEELRPKMPILKALCAPHRVLRGSTATSQAS